MKRFDFIMKWVLKAIGAFAIAFCFVCFIVGSYECEIALSVVRNEPVSMYTIICLTIGYFIAFVVGGYMLGKANFIRDIKENFKEDFKEVFSKDKAV